jgi:hypothetical protein
MSYLPHCRIVIRGFFINTPEEWSFSTKWLKHYSDLNDLDINNIDESGMLGAVTTLIASGLFNNRVQCSGWRAYDIGSDGNMVGNPRVVEIPTASQPKGTGPLLYPPQASLTVTLEGENRGPARFGRFYLPGPAHALGTDLRLSTVSQTSYLNAAGAFLTDMADAIDIPGGVTRAELINVSGIDGGHQQNVVKVRMGRVLDTIRRRRTSLLEEYSELSPYTA